MEKNIKKIYIIEAIIFVFIVFYKFCVLKFLNQYATLINLLFWVSLIVGLVALNGFPKDRHPLKKNCIRTIIIVFVVIFILSYIFGLFTGFYKPIYSHKFINIVKNIGGQIISIILLEITRYLIMKKSPNSPQRLMLAFIYVTYYIVIGFNSYKFGSAEQIFLFLALIVMPKFAEEFLYNYITYNVSFVPVLVYRILMENYIFIVPILPNFGNYLTSVFGVFIPFVVYKQIKKEIELRDKYGDYAKKYIIKFVLGLVVFFLVLLVYLISGIGKYTMIGIASNSMSPTYERGDAIIYKKVDIKDIKKGSIIVFKYNDKIITHRVVEVNNKDGIYSFNTKGDNNNKNDNFEVKSKDVYGSVRYIVKYIAFPTVWFNELRK